NKIEEELEKLSQKLLAQWALNVAVPYLDYLDNHLKDDPRICLGIETLEKRIEGHIRAYDLRKVGFTNHKLLYALLFVFHIRAYDLRKVGFTVNELAKESKTNTSKYSARSFAQAIATGHMRGHAMVSSDYA